MLKLTTQQASDLERIGSEACAAMAKYHEQLLAVLSPEQRAKLQEVHSRGGSLNSRQRTAAAAIWTCVAATRSSADACV